MAPKLTIALNAIGYSPKAATTDRIDILNAIRVFAVQCQNAEIEIACGDAIEGIRNGSEGKVSDAQAKNGIALLRGLMESLKAGTQFNSGNDELDQILSMAGGQPTEAMQRVFSGYGSQADLNIVKFYIETLEHFREHPSIEYKRPATDQILKAGSYSFNPPDAIEGRTRDFTITIYRDRTALWLDQQGKLASRTDKNVVIKTMLGDQQSRNALVRENDEFTLETSIGDEAYYLIAEKEAIMAQGWDVTPAICDNIDRILTPYFWADVNPLLPNPLTRKSST